ncbi:protein FRA10AC1 isoform X1 [Denticeps clupeoides]|uniref:Protein FRA10AC1 n=1 Tax=Denticeps clupeoides TaxID=299321 RepID=A0AAY4AEN5_9TELE|nr:protein FRA10AC1 isoform X1 [Denticeps clupeoides]
MEERGLDLVKVHGGGGYDSDFSDEEGQDGSVGSHGVKRAREDQLLLQKPFQKGTRAKVAHRDVASQELDREEARNRRQHLISMNAFERHKKFVGDYILYYGGKMDDLRRSTAKDKTDLDVVRENHRFLWRDEDEEDMTWEKELAKRYYDKLFKEYCIADLNRYKENKFGFRWRIENEVVSGKGQFLCGNKRCEMQESLKSWEVNFAYVEHGEKRNALVKLRLCPDCSFKLNYHHKRKEVKTKRKRSSSGAGDEPQRPESTSSRPKKLKKHKRKQKRSRKDSSSARSSDDSDRASDDEGSGEEQAEKGTSEGDHWKGPVPVTEEKSREEEFDEYFEDMFL